MTEDTTLSSLGAVPVRYRFVSIHRIAGLAGLPRDRPMPLNINRPQMSVRLIGDSNSDLQQIDHGVALAQYMLMAFVGQAPSGVPLDVVKASAEAIARERARKFGPGGVYMIVEVTGAVVSTPSEVARDFGEGLCAFDAVDKDAIKASHRSLVSAALASVVLIAGQTPDIMEVTEGVELKLADGRPLFSFKFSGFNPRFMTARLVTDQDGREIERMIDVVLTDDHFATPCRLLVDALRHIDDRLESFILTWAALEVLVNKHAAGCETGTWVATVPEASREAATKIHSDFIKGKHRSYSFSDRVRVFALTHEIESVDDTIATTTRIQKFFRNPLYHQGMFIEKDLPVEELGGLTRRLITAAIDRRRPPKV